LGFVGQYLGLIYFIKQTAISACPHAFGLIGKWLGDPDTDAQALLQFVGSPERPLPRGFKLAGIGEFGAMSAHKIAVREVQLGYAPSTISATRSRADEIGTAAAESTRQMDDGDGIGHVSPFPIPDPHGIGQMQSLTLSTEVD
jgi:hypothetical protein